MLKFEKAGKHEKWQIQSHHEGHEGSEVKPGSAGRRTGFMDLFDQSKNSRKPVRRPALPGMGNLKLAKQVFPANAGSVQGVQNEAKRCPKWSETIENGKLKVENEKHKTLCSTTIQSIGVAVKN